MVAQQRQDAARIAIRGPACRRHLQVPRVAFQQRHLQLPLHLAHLPAHGRKSARDPRSLAVWFAANPHY